ncbi:MAG TPA: AAA family ATPase [Terriglobales bacterium]|nr:AAA family ATPase [Terriglobales bacterium]
MYKQFYKLRRNPFEITPDPSFLFLTRRHKEALAALYHGVRRRKGFVVLTGEVGTGKTLLIRCLLKLLKGSDVSCAYVFNSRLSPLEFLQFIAVDLGLPVAGKNKAEILHELCNFVSARHQRKLTTLVIVDEAHHLPTEALEEVRLLTNLETAQQKMLQILLAGQPEFAGKLDSFELRQLKQRVALRSHLKPLDLDETIGYVRRRLQLAGAGEQADIFPEDTIAKIHRHARGIPRVINTICENALITAYARQMHKIPAGIIEEVADDLCLGVASSPAMQTGRGSDEVLNAVRTLLELHSHLQGTAELARPSLAPGLDLSHIERDSLKPTIKI